MMHGDEVYHAINPFNYLFRDHLSSNAASIKFGRT
jgi:hypothetical protein